MNYIIREIQPQDNEALAKMIRSVLTEFGANREGTVFTDPSTDALYELFQTPLSKYFVAFEGERLVGGSGIFPSEGMPDNCTELVKLYVDQTARGTGLGKLLMVKSIEAAKELGYGEIYLETLPELHLAVGLYERMGFQYMKMPYGNTGHFACDLWMHKFL